MKPAPFAYRKVEAVGEAFALLREHGDDAAILAGGQSLVPALNLRLATPSLVIDINGLDDLAGITVGEREIRIGALARHAALERCAAIAEHAPLLHLALPHIAHPAIRNRGTVGGSLALADPAAELPACALALAAEIELASEAGTRRLPAADYFLGLYETARRSDELVSALIIPRVAGWRSAFMEFARRHGDYALAGLAVHARHDGDRLRDVRLAFFGVGAKPVLAKAAAAELDGRPIDAGTIARAAAALESDLEPTDDLHASAALKRQLARVLTGRVLRRLDEAAA